MPLDRLCENSDIWGYDESFVVRDFLEAINSPRLKDLPEFADWVQEAAKKYDINPRILLAIAQKEQSFLTRKHGGTGWRRALDWTMGYGATNGGDIPRYAGCKNQVFSAARGLRRYWDSGRVKAMVGKPLRATIRAAGATGRIVPKNEATAALYLYTPHISGAKNFLRVWKWLKGVEAKMAARRAEPQIGSNRLYPNGHPRPLRRTGRQDWGHISHWYEGPCSRTPLTTVRIPILGRIYVHRRAAEAFKCVFEEIEKDGLGDLIDLKDYGGTYACRRVRGGRSFSPHAWGIAIDLNVHHLQGSTGEYRSYHRTNWRCKPEEIPGSLKKLAPYFWRWGFSWGGDWLSFKDPMHFEATEFTVMILEGKGQTLPEAFVKACNPPIESDIAGGYTPGPVKIVLLPQNKVIDCNAALEGDKTRCDLRSLAEALGYNVVDHIADQRKVYLLPREVDA